MRRSDDAYGPDEWSDPKAATIQFLRARSKCAVVTEEISLRDKLLMGVSASEAPEEPPVQASTADSWGFPDIDLWFFFLIRALSSTYYSVCRADAVVSVYTDARTSVSHNVFIVHYNWLYVYNVISTEGI